MNTDGGCEGHGTIVWLLLEWRADVNAQGRFFGNELQAASWKGDGAKRTAQSGPKRTAQSGPKRTAQSGVIERRRRKRTAQSGPKRTQADGAKRRHRKETAQSGPKRTAQSGVIEKRRRKRTAQSCVIERRRRKRTAQSGVIERRRRKRTAQSGVLKCYFCLGRFGLLFRPQSIFALSTNPWCPTLHTYLSCHSSVIASPPIYVPINQHMCHGNNVYVSPLCFSFASDLTAACYTLCNTIPELRSLLPLDPCLFPRPLLCIHYFPILHSNFKP